MENLKSIRAGKILDTYCGRIIIGFIVYNFKFHIEIIEFNSAIGIQDYLAGHCADTAVGMLYDIHIADDKSTVAGILIIVNIASL